MDKQKLKGLWIPAMILLDENLSDKEKIILSIILYLSKETGSCFASNKYLAGIVNVTSDRVSKIVSMLNKKRYIEVKLKYKLESKEVENRQIIPNKNKVNLYCDKVIDGIGKNNYSNGSKELYPIGENNKDIISNNINKNIYNDGKFMNKKFEFEYEKRDYSNYDFSKLYVN